MAIMVTTLMMANQNSNSPNNLAAVKFAKVSKPRKIRVVAQRGKSGNQKFT